MKPLRILLAEDNPGDVLLVREALREHGIEHELDVVKNGQEALDFVAGIGGSDQFPCPGVLLLDLNLPRADGPTVLARFRQVPGCSQTPVVIVTSSDSEKDRARVAEFNVSHYFRKPSDYDAYMTLGAVVLEAIGRPKPAER